MNSKSIKLLSKLVLATLLLPTMLFGQAGVLYNQTTKDVMQTNLNRAMATQIVARASLGVGVTNPAAMLQVSNPPTGASVLARIGTNATSGLTVNSNGNVGIGLSDPQESLHITNGNLRVSGSSSNTPIFRIQSAANVTMQTNFFQMATNAGVPFFVISSNKFVGIGTNAPAVPLHVVQSLAATQALRIDDTNFTKRLQFGTLPGGSTFGTFWLGDINNTANNYSLSGDGAALYVNATTAINFPISGTVQWTLDGVSLRPNGDNTEFLGDSTHRIARLDIGTAGITNAGPLFVTGVADLQNFNARAENNQFKVWNQGIFGFSTTAGANGNPDTALYRPSAGNVGITNGLRIPLAGGIGIGNGGVTLTNILTGSATLDFASGTSSSEDLPITVTGAADGDEAVAVPPVAATTGISGSWTAIASNNVVFVRFTTPGTGQNPPSGTYKVYVRKYQ